MRRNSRGSNSTIPAGGGKNIGEAQPRVVIAHQAPITINRPRTPRGSTGSLGSRMADLTLGFRLSRTSTLALI